MSLQGEVVKRTLQFKFDAGTSRGVLREKDSFFIKIFEKYRTHPFGIGECSPLQGLSIDYGDGLELQLQEAMHRLSAWSVPETHQQAYDIAENIAGEAMPSLRFALEVALIDLMNGGQRTIFKNPFSEGLEPIAINGLIWMGSREFMLKQIKEKLDSGFNCIKLKIGAIDFETECSVLAYIRNEFSPDEVEIRVDANGAFSGEDVLPKLERLSHYGIHSIEQPVAAGQIDFMQKVCAKSPVPIALDEELIGIYGKNKAELLDAINPHYIILKPTLLGGLKETAGWISIAEAKQLKWWITSALESNIGLNAICQFTAEFANPLPQGLGTGQLYLNNIPSPLEVGNGLIVYNINKNWELYTLGT